MQEILSDSHSIFSDWQQVCIYEWSLCLSLEMLTTNNNCLMQCVLFLIFEFLIAIVNLFTQEYVVHVLKWKSFLPIITIHNNGWLFLHVACMNAHLQPILSIIKQDVDAEHWHKQAVKHSGGTEQMWIIFAGNIINVSNLNFVLLFFFF